MAEALAIYPSPNSAYGVVAVEVGTNPTDIEHYAPLIEGVRLVAYRRRFEVLSDTFPTGTIEERFANPNKKEFVRKQAVRMEDAAKKGSRYIAVHFLDYNEKPGTLLAVSKSTPSRPRRFGIFKSREEDANCYLDDVISATVGSGDGLVAMHQAVLPYRDDRKVVMDVFDEHDVIAGESTWFRGMNFVVEGAVEAPVVIADKRVPQLRVASTVDAVIAAIIARRSWIAAYTKVSSPDEAP